MSASDVATLESIFAPRAALPTNFLRRVLQSHAGDLARAADYLLSLSDADLCAAAAPPPPRLRSYTHLQPAALDLSDPAQATAILDNLKDIVVPALKAELAGLRFADLHAESDRVNYSLSGLRLSSLTLQPAQIAVEVAPEGRVGVVVTEAALEVDVEQWRYRLRFPPIRDAGRAHFSFAGVRADILLVIDERASSLAVESCTCNIAGAISFRASDARLSWLYNSLAPMLKSAIRPPLESTLATAIKSGLEQQLADWSSWAA